MLRTPGRRAIRRPGLECLHYQETDELKTGPDKTMDELRFLKTEKSLLLGKWIQINWRFISQTSHGQSIKISCNDWRLVKYTWYGYICIINQAGKWQRPCRLLAEALKSNETSVPWPIMSGFIHFRSHYYWTPGAGASELKLIIIHLSVYESGSICHVKKKTNIKQHLGGKKKRFWDSDTTLTVMLLAYAANV